jgi:hypothetical protein
MEPIVDSYDPTTVGPAGRCLVCFTVDSDAVAYCTNCGHIGMVFAVRRGLRPGQACAYHPAVAAKGICSLCAEAICSSCLEVDGISLVRGSQNLRCVTCIERSGRLEISFRARLEQSRQCAKHADRAAAARCKTCRLPHCPACLYFTRKGWLRKRLGDGPYCLICFRLAAIANFGARERWITLQKAKEMGLLESIDPSLMMQPSG